MSLPHPLSTIIPLAELDLFHVPPTQSSVFETITPIVRPERPLEDNQSPIEFEFKNELDEYCMLSEVKFHFQLQVDIKKTSGDVTADDWKKISITNNFLHSLFKTAELRVNDKILTLSPQNYAYKAYFENSLGYTWDSKQSLTGSWGMFLDSDVKESFDDDDKVCEMLTPTTIAKDGTGKIIDLIGKLHFDLFMQPKALIGGTLVRIQLVPNQKEFYLNIKTGISIKNIKFLKAHLTVPKLKVNPLIVDAQNSALTKGNAKYAITRGEVKQFNIPKGQTDIIIPNVYNGQIPRRMFIVFLKNEAFNGSLSENPYNFKNYNVNYLTTYKDGVSIPSVPFTPDYEQNTFTREYLSVFEALNLFNTDCYLNIERNFFAKGNAIYGINYAADLCDDYMKSGYIDPKKNGNIAIHVGFKQAPTDTVVMLVYGELDNFIEFDINRQVYTDYN